MGDVGQALDGRVIAVAGGAGTLGPTVVRRLASAGAHTCVCGRDQDSLDELAAQIEATIETDVVDLLDPDATNAWAVNATTLTTSNQNLGTSYSYGSASAHTLYLTVPFSASTGAISKIVNFTATSN